MFSILQLNMRKLFSFAYFFLFLLVLAGTKHDFTLFEWEKNEGTKSDRKMVLSSHPSPILCPFGIENVELKMQNF